MPLTGNYGSDLACKLYDDGGTEAVMSNGDTFTPPKPDAANPFLIVRPDGVDGYDLTCEIYDSTDLKAGGWVVTLFCSENGDEAGDITLGPHRRGYRQGHDRLCGWPTLDHA